MKWWHRWRAEVWERKAYIAYGEAAFLEQLATSSGNSYYADKWHDAVCRRLRADSALKYHEDKSK